jgi:phage terminase small subunit
MLNQRQQRFCEEYLADLNATQAAIRAGYSKNSAKQIACQLLADPGIKNKLAGMIQDHSDQITILQETVLRKLWNVANSDIRDFLSFAPQKLKVADPLTGIETEKDMGMQVTFKDAGSMDTSNIIEISLKKNGVSKFRLGNREKALDQLAKRLDILSKAAGNQHLYRETIEPIFLIPENEEDTITD